MENLDEELTVEDFEEIGNIADRLRAEISEAIIGQEEVVEQILMLLLSGGHGLLIGVPGLAKTLMVQTISNVTKLSFKRIQFTPDLMPSDITGTEVIEENKTTGEREFRFVKGPIFSQVILADEINRTPPKTQAALLEAMQEEHVTVANQTYSLPEPFLVLATQNPIEQEGTYPLPEAQLDRFMFMIKIDYPEEDEEHEIIRRESQADRFDVEPVVTAKKIQEIRSRVRSVVASNHVSQYALNLVRASRPDSNQAPDFVKNNVEWGGGPRAGLHLLLAGKAHAAFRGEPQLAVEDVQEVALPVLRHRVLLNFVAEAEGKSSEEIINRLLETTPEPGAT